MGNCARLKEEFGSHNFRLPYEYPDDFCLHQWQSSTRMDPFYVFYRFLFCMIFVALAYIAIRWSSSLPFAARIKSGVFFTNWSFLICTINSFLSLCLVARVYKKQCNSGTNELPDLPKLCRAYWVLQNVSAELAFGVTITYWTLIHLTENLSIGRWTSAFHIWNTSLQLMDFFIVAVPVKIMHVYFSIIIALIYIIFTYIYYQVGGTRFDGKHYIYKLIDWRDHPVRAFFMCTSAILFLLIIRFLMFGLFRLRVWIFYMYYDEEDMDNSGRRRFVL